MNTARIIGAIVTNPLVVATVIVGVIAIVARDRPTNRAVTPVGIRVTSAAIILAWALLYVGQLLLVGPGGIWLELAYPLLIAAGGLGVFAVMLRPSDAASGLPAKVGIRRTWHSFVSTKLLTTAAILVAAILVTTIVCGSFSTYFPEWGHDVSHTEFGTQGSMTQSVYGWTYGAPTLVSTGLLVLAVVFALHRISTPPLATNGAGTRTTQSNSVALLAIASLLLTFGRILQYIGSSGMSGSTITLADGSEFFVASNYAAFAGVFLWGGLLLEIIAFVLLLGLAFNLIGLRAMPTTQRTLQAAS